MAVDRVPIPKAVRNRDNVPWRLSIGKEFTQDELTAVAAVFLDGTTHHYLIAADVYPGITQMVGDYWATKGHGKDLSQVAKRWDDVQARFPDLIIDSVLEYRVPAALLDTDELTPVNPALGLPPE